MSIIIGADFVPTSSNISFFREGDIRGLLGEELEHTLRSADWRIFNLEMPLCDRETPISKCGPNLRAGTSAACLYRKANVNLVTLANNHIMDQGEDGLRSTIKTLEEHGISVFGAGYNISEAAKPFIIDIKGMKVGLYGCVEHEFSIANQNKPGANPYDPLVSFDHVSELKTCCNYVIVLYHGGKEFYRYPSPELQRTCRKFAEVGADLVLCQHSHCIGSIEKYNNVTILYGQGNFLFDHGDNEYWNSGLLVKLGDDMKLELIPVIKDKEKVRLASESEKTQIIGEINKRSKNVTNSAFISEQYRKFAISNANRYLLSIYGITNKNIVFRIINKLTGHRFEKYVLEHRYGKESLLYILNYVDCEAQRELFIEGVRALLENDNKPLDESVI